MLLIYAGYCKGARKFVKTVLDVVMVSLGFAAIIEEKKTLAFCGTSVRLKLKIFV